MNIEPALHGKRVLVTGVAGGIGHAIADLLRSLGATVLGTDRSGLAPEGVTMIQADLTVPADRERVYAAAGTVDFLINAAGVSITKNLADTTESDWDTVLTINSKVPFLLMQHFATSMPAGGAVVNIASVAGKMATNIEGAPYNASKAAVIALTKTFAYALAPRGIRVNAVCPGVTDTPMLTEIFQQHSALSGDPVDQVVQQYLTRVPLQRLGDTAEIADAVTFLLSHQARYMTGQSINVCGGLVMS